MCAISREAESGQTGLLHWRTYRYSTLIKKNRIFLIYEKIQKGSIAKSDMTTGLLIYGKIFSHFLIY